MSQVQYLYCWCGIHECGAAAVLQIAGSSIAAVPRCFSRHCVHNTREAGAAKEGLLLPSIKKMKISGLAVDSKIDALSLVSRVLRLACETTYI